MASRSHVSFNERGQTHPHPLAKRLFEIAEHKRSNLVLSADLTTTEALLNIADSLGPYIVVLKTHIDILSDFSEETIKGLQRLSTKHNFLIFEDRKFIDIGNTVKKQYKGGVLRIHEWAHIVNVSVLPGPGIIQALQETINSGGLEDRGILILAEMTSKGSLATGSYTSASIDFARQFPQTVLGWVATRELSSNSDKKVEGEDFVVFTTGVNISSKGDALGQQYQDPVSAMKGGSDFLIAGRGIYASKDPVAAVKEYQSAGWDAYLARIQHSSS